MVTENQKQQIIELRKKGVSGSKIAKQIKMRKTDTLATIRQIENKKLPKSSKIIFTPTKYLTPKRKEKKQKIIKRRIEFRERKKPLSKKEINIIKEKINKKEPDYKIIKEFSPTKQKKVKKVISSIKKKEKKDKLKDVNKKFDNKCKFNYITQHHIGYKFQKSCSYIIYEGISDVEINDIIKSIVNILEILHSNVRCSQRINYASLEYKIVFVDKSIDYSKISTNINTEFGLSNFNTMINQIPDIIYHLVNVVHQGQSSKEIEIYNVVYVNYDFKYNV